MCLMDVNSLLSPAGRITVQRGHMKRERVKVCYFAQQSWLMFSATYIGGKGIEDLPGIVKRTESQPEAEANVSMWHPGTKLVLTNNYFEKRKRTKVGKRHLQLCMVHWDFPVLFRPRRPYHASWTTALSALLEPPSPCVCLHGPPELPSPFH